MRINKKAQTELNWKSPKFVVGLILVLLAGLLLFLWISKIQGGFAP